MRVARTAALVITFTLAGCVMPWVDDPPYPSTTIGPTPTTPEDIGPPLTFAGIVLDARDGAPLADAEARIDLAQVRPCARQGLLWTSWPMTTDAEGRFGPVTIPRPRTDDVAFFLHASMDGYAPEVKLIGPAEARGDVGNLTMVLHPDVWLNGTAPPGTVIALDSPGFPRLAAADAEGRFAFARARVTDAQLVAATPTPFTAIVRAPAEVDVPASNASGWRLEGTVKDDRGAAIEADVVAWNGTALVSAARSSRSGDFVLPLPAEPLGLRVEARTADGRYGGAKAIDVEGPAALRETVIVRALC